MLSQTCSPKRGAFGALMICLDDFEPRCLLEAPVWRSTAVHDHRAVLVEELLPRFLLAAFDREFDVTKAQWIR